MRKLICTVLSVILMLGILSVPACAASGESNTGTQSSAESGEKAFSSIEELNREGVKIGIVTGTVHDELCTKYLPNAELVYFNGYSDTIYALTAGLIDAYLDDGPMIQYTAAHTGGMERIEEVIGEPYDIAFAIGKTEFCDKLRAELDEFIRRLKADGTMDEIMNFWYKAEGEEARIDIPAEGENGIVRLAIFAQTPPAAMVVNGEEVGIEIDILARFCREYGYRLEIDNVDFNAIINGVVSGRFDLGSGFLYVTEERSQSVNFSEPYTQGGAMAAVRLVEQSDDSFWARLSASFERTFIKESRWKLIAQGVKTTMIIAVGASLLGTVLGFGLCLLRRMNNRAVFAATTAYIRIMQGTPLLVLLMILYYIVFAKSGMKGELVAIFAFALNFAAYVCEMFRTGIDGVDKGQTEAAYALGYTKVQAFTRIIMPQAAMRFLPVYKGEFISLVKSTSIVGYIAVQDLTKMSDIIRSRTYEAFFPLIATALIYFILSALLTGLLRAIEIKVEPDRVNRKPKGVKLQ